MIQNEITLLMEAGYKAFSREDLLEKGVYSPVTLTRNIKKLMEKGLLVENDGAKHKKVYSLKSGEILFKEKSDVINEIARSRAVTLNSIRKAAFLLYNENNFCSARYIAKELEMDVEYLVNTVLPRMWVLNLVVRKELTIETK